MPNRTATYTLVLLLICSGAWGFGPESCGDSIAVTDGTYTFSISDMCYYLTGDLTASGSAWHIASGVHDITIDMGEYSLTYGYSLSSTYDTAVVFAGNNYNITIHGDSLDHAAIIHGGDDLSDRCVGIVFGADSSVKLEFLDVHVRGTNGHCMATTGETQELYCHLCSYTSDVHSFTSANNNDGHAIHFNALPTDTANGAYHVRMHKCSTWAPAGFTCDGEIIYDSNYSYIDARNDYYTYPTATSDLGTKNCTGVGGGFAAGTWIHDNVFVAGSTYTGSDIAVMIQTAHGNDQDTIIVENNTILARKGKDPHYGYNVDGGLAGKAVKIRFGVEWVCVRNNTISVYLGDTSQSCYGTKAAGIWYVGNSGSYPDSNLFIYGNDITMYAVGDDINSDGIRGAYLGDTISAFTTNASNWDSTNICWYGNTIRSNGWCYNVGGDDGSCNGARIYEDTVLIDTAIAGVHNNIYGLATDYSNRSMNNVFQDMYMLESTDELGINVYNQPDTVTLSLRRTLDVLVLASGVPQEDHIVTTVNNYGDTVAIDTTDENGYVHPVVTYAKWLGHTSNPPDSLYYNDIRFYTTINSADVVDSLTVEWDNYACTLDGEMATWDVAFQNLGSDTGSGPIDDASLYDYASVDSLNYGASQFIYAVAWDASTEEGTQYYGINSLIRLDSLYEYIGPGMVIVDAYMQLTRYSSASPDMSVVIVRRCLKPWREGGKNGASAGAGEVTGASWRHGDSLWQCYQEGGKYYRNVCMGGADDDENMCTGGYDDCGADDECWDIDSTVLDSAFIDVSQSSYTWDITDAAQAAYEAQSDLNLILQMRHPAGTTDPYAYFYSSNYSRSKSRRPLFMVTYGEATSTSDTTGHIRGGYYRGGYLK